MFKALFYKEWIKLRWLILVLGVISLAAFVKMFLHIGAAIEIKGAYHLWYMVSVKKAIIYSDIKFLLPFAGIVISLAQFVPETRQRRLRLLFHLPVNHNKSLFFMLFTGILAVLFILILNLVLLIIMIKFYFPAVIVKSAVITILPWLISGLAAYMGISLAAVEPSMWRKVVYAVLAFSMIMLFYKGKGPGIYEISIHKYIILTLLYTFSLLLPAFRFKRGLA